MDLALNLNIKEDLFAYDNTGLPSVSSKRSTNSLSGSGGIGGPSADSAVKEVLDRKDAVESEPPA